MPCILEKLYYSMMEHGTQDVLQSLPYSSYIQEPVCLGMNIGCAKISQKFIALVCDDVQKHKNRI